MLPKRQIIVKTLSRLLAFAAMIYGGTAVAQHDGHREAVIEITSGQPEQAKERLEKLLSDPASLWRGKSLIHGHMLGHVTDEAASFWVRTAGESVVTVQVNQDNCFGVLDFDTARPDPRLVFEIRSIDDELIWSHQLLLSELSH